MPNSDDFFPRAAREWPNHPTRAKARQLKNELSFWLARGQFRNRGLGSRHRSSWCVDQQERCLKSRSRWGGILGRMRNVGYSGYDRLGVYRGSLVAIREEGASALLLFCHFVATSFVTRGLKTVSAGLWLSLICHHQYILNPSNIVAICHFTFLSQLLANSVLGAPPSIL